MWISKLSELKILSKRFFYTNSLFYESISILIIMFSLFLDDDMFAMDM